MSDKFRKAFRRFLFCGKLNEPLHNHLYCYNRALKAPRVNHQHHSHASEAALTHVVANESSGRTASSWRISQSKHEDHSPAYGKSNTTTSALINNQSSYKSPGANQETQC
ncbi:Hypothetical protein FKW44_021219 [Caligus rogercresseyi]|uniref:Uncharacterized protein n=1 Tax=Caligus rogercresseyi TaxID=217165 RepID=A0A7T8GR40_CALRO|nr:Hypothetical protein FKW44_021219 [Caligus rogercresseyi]